MYEHLLVPVAFDADHDPAHAIEIARALSADGARITLLHVMDEVPPYAISYLPEGFRSGAREALTADLEERAAALTDAGAVVVEGRPATAILDWAEAHGVDCIVIASHRPGVSDYFLGSTAARVVRHARCAVHVLR